MRKVCPQLKLYCLEVPTMLAKIGVDGRMEVLAKAGERGDWPGLVDQCAENDTLSQDAAECGQIFGDKQKKLDKGIRTAVRLCMWELKYMMEQETIEVPVVYKANTFGQAPSGQLLINSHGPADSTGKDTSLRESKLEGCCQGPQDLSSLKKNEFHAASLNQERKYRVCPDLNDFSEIQRLNLVFLGEPGRPLWFE
ncbi:hypothetical protein EK904_006361 [Melospiza melodia maxima]|nr:hypothetical protein EK904_006361 [Melospiza melodia maxima]